jgi:hypothetical protein
VRWIGGDAQGRGHLTADELKGLARKEVSYLIDHDKCVLRRLSWKERDVLIAAKPNDLGVGRKISQENCLPQLEDAVPSTSPESIVELLEVVQVVTLRPRWACCRTAAGLPACWSDALWEVPGPSSLTQHEEQSPGRSRGSSSPGIRA